MTEILTYGPGTLVGGPSLGAACPRCGAFICRVRGNLQLQSSWENASRSLFAKHLRGCRGKR